MWILKVFIRSHCFVKFITFLTSSLYGNAIADIGAEHLALVLPQINLLQDLE